MMPRPPFQPALSFPLFALRHRRRRRRRIHIQLPLILYIRRLTLAGPYPTSLHTALAFNLLDAQGHSFPNCPSDPLFQKQITPCVAHLAHSS